MIIPVSGLGQFFINENEDGKAVGIESDFKVNCPNCDTPDCYYDCDQSKSDCSLETDEQLANRARYNGCIDGIESLTLALYSKGFVVNGPSYREALLEALEAIENNLG